MNHKVTEVPILKVATILAELKMLGITPLGLAAYSKAVELKALAKDPAFGGGTVTPLELLTMLEESIAFMEFSQGFFADVRAIAEVLYAS